MGCNQHKIDVKFRIFCNIPTICKPVISFPFVQVNEETGNRRPVMLTVQRVPRMPKTNKPGNAADSEREEEQRVKTEETRAEAGSIQTRTPAFPFVHSSSTNNFIVIKL